LLALFFAFSSEMENEDNLEPVIWPAVLAARV
jgi:hypothetical protein